MYDTNSISWFDETYNLLFLELRNSGKFKIDLPFNVQIHLIPTMYPQLPTRLL